MPQTRDGYKSTPKPIKTPLPVYGPPAPPVLNRPPTVTVTANPSPWAGSLPAFPSLPVLPPVTTTKLSVPFWETDKFRAIVQKAGGVTSPLLPGYVSPEQKRINLLTNAGRSVGYNNPTPLSESEYVNKYELGKPIAPAQGTAGRFPQQRVLAGAGIPNQPEPTHLTDKMYPTPESSGRDTGASTIRSIKGEDVPFTSQTAVRATRMGLVNDAIMLGWSQQRIDNALKVYDALNGLQKFMPFNAATAAVEEIADESSPAVIPSAANVWSNSFFYAMEGIRKNWELQSPIRVSTTTGKWSLQSPVLADNVYEVRTERARIEAELRSGYENVGEYYSPQKALLTPDRRLELQDRVNQLDEREASN